MSSKAKWAVAGLGMMVTGTTVCIGWFSTSTLVLGSLLVGGGLCMLLFLGTMNIANWAETFVRKHDDTHPKFDIDRKLTWDDDGRK